MWTWLRRLLAVPTFEDEEEARVAALLGTIALTLTASIVVFAIVTLILYGLPADLLGWSTPAVEAIVVAFSLGALFLIRRRILQPVSWTFCLVLWAVTTFALYNYGGLLDAMIGGYLLVVILAAITLGGRGILALTLLSALSGIGLFYGEVSGHLQFDRRVVEPFDLLSFFMILALVALLLRYALGSLVRALERARRHERALDEANRELQLSRDVLQTRTLELERRSRYLEATAEVAREASLMLDLEQLLPHIVALISKWFEPYRAFIFLLDPSRQWAVLRAASGQGGARLVARDFRLEVAGRGIVAHVIRSGQPYVTSDVSQDPLYLRVEEVADARSELTLPLHARGETIGALAVQSPELDAFHEQEIAVLQTLADQVALAISNALLFQQAQKSLEAERQAYGRLGRQSWLQIIRARPELAVRRDEEGLSVVSGGLDAEARRALQTGQATYGEGATSLAIPLRVRGQIIGAIDAHKRGDSGGWTADQIALLETLAQNLGDALEGARLYQEAQRRAAQEQLIGQVTARMRETLDVETVLKTAIREMGLALGIDRVEVRLKSVQARPDNGRDQAGGEGEHA